MSREDISQNVCPSSSPRDVFENVYRYHVDKMQEIILREKISFSTPEDCKL